MLESLHALQCRYLTSTVLIIGLFIVIVKLLSETHTWGHRNCFADISQVDRRFLWNVSSAALYHRACLARIHLLHLVCNLIHSLVEGLRHILTDRSSLFIHFLVKPLLLWKALLSLAFDFQDSILAGSRFHTYIFPKPGMSLRSYLSCLRASNWIPLSSVRYLFVLDLKG